MEPSEQELKQIVGELNQMAQRLNQMYMQIRYGYAREGADLLEAAKIANSVEITLTSDLKLRQMMRS